MATETFDKNIIIDDRAADKIIEVLNKQPENVFTKTEINDLFERSSKALEWLLSSSKTSSEQIRKISSNDTAIIKN